MAEITRSVYQTLGLNHNVTTNQKVIKLSDSLNLTDTRNTKGLNVSNLSDTLLLYNSVKLTNAVYNKSITDTIIFIDKARRAKTIDLTHVLSLSDSAARYGPLSQLVTFTHSATVGKSKITKSTLGLSDNVTLNYSKTFALSHSIEFLGWANGYILPAIERTRPGSPVPTEVRTTIAADRIYTPIGSMGIDPGTFILSGNTSVTLRAPEFGNTEGATYRVVDLTSRGGEHIYERRKGSSFSKTRNETWQFAHLTYDNAKAVMSFVDSNLGKQITITDHTGATWAVVITSQVQMTQQGRYNYTTSFEVENV